MSGDDEPPSFFLRRPILGEGLGLYVTAYNELKYDRPAGFGIGPIPWSSINTWARCHYIDDPDDIAILEHHMRAIENAFAEREEKKKGGKK